MRRKGRGRVLSDLGENCRRKGGKLTRGEGEGRRRHQKTTHLQEHLLWRGQSRFHGGNCTL